MQQQKHHLAAILFTDIVGYTAIMQRDELQALAVIRHYNSVLENVVSEHNGEVVNNYGDGSLCTFNSATEAIKCAVEIQKQLQIEPAVPLRIGLHIGEIFLEDGKVFGDGVNVASRIQSLGLANTILFSGEINNKIKNQAEFKSVSLGRFAFKNVDDPMEVFALANDGLVVPKKAEMTGKLKEAGKKFSIKKILLAGGAMILLIIALLASQKFFSSKEITNKDKSIAVLPFNNLSINKEENEPFCVGVTLELQKNLAWMSELIPIAPQSVEKYRNTKMSIADIARELGGIKYIVQGTVQRDKNKIKVFASLIDAINGKQLWSDNYPGVVEDIFPLQENIAQQIASALQINITPEEKKHIERVPTKNTKAWDVFNEAQMRFARYAFTINPNETEYRKIQSLCDKTLQLDSNLAEAYVLKARAYWIANFKNEFYSKNFMDTVELLCLKALTIDNNSVDALVQLNEYYHRTGKKELALQQLEKAIILNPNSFAANWALGTGNPQLYYDPVKSIKSLRKALKLDPLSVWTPEIYNDLAYQYLDICDFEKSEFYSNKVLELELNTKAASRAYWCLVVTNNRLGRADKIIELGEKWKKIDSSEALYHIAEAWCYLKNDCSKAVQLYEHFYKISPLNVNIHRWAVALWETGKREEAFKLMHKSIEQYKKMDSLGRYEFADYDMAGVYAFIGDKKMAYEILKIWQERNHWPWGSPYLIKIDPLFDNLRSDKEFKELVETALIEKKKLREKIKNMEERGEL